MAPPPPAARAVGRKVAGPAARIAAVIGIIGSAIGIVGSFTTWVKTSGYMVTVRVGGLSGDGKITLALSAIALLFFVLALFIQGRAMFIVGLVLTILSAGIFVYHFVDKARIGIGYLGIGLYLGVIGGAAAIVGAIMGISAKRA